MMLQYYIPQNSSIRDALNKIIENRQGFVLTSDDSGIIVGLVTDGDIRSKLVEGISLDESISVCANTNFIWADEYTPREIILKQLDNSIRFIPLLDKYRRLKDIVTRYHLPIANEEKVYARAKSPVRISFGGGGSDLTHYFLESNGAVINSTISLYSHATLIKRDDQQIYIYSRDLGETVHAQNLSEALNHSGNFKLILSLIKIIHPVNGFELFLYSDFPMKSGLGGSAVVASSILGCFNQFRTDKWDQYEMAELAYQAERLYLDIAGGWQDQYATIFGGFNFMEFKSEQNIIHPLRLDSETILELEECLVLCDTGTIHESGDVHNDQKNEMSKQSIRDLVKENVELTYGMRNQLLRGKLLEFGESLNQAWQLKRQFSSQISNSSLDHIYDTAIKSGAIGGKLLGAGGGGFFLFFVPATRKHQLMNALEKIGKAIRPFRFEEKGLQGWTVRENNNKI
jgi:D-glycero-alpha-D-manno-heptose-7-phosphate kinase